MIDTIKTFPNTYKNLDTDLLISAFAAGPQRIRKAVDGLSEEQLYVQPRPGKWSIKEMVVHLADAEIMGAARIRQTYAEPGSSFAVYNQEAWAMAFQYNRFPATKWRAALRLFEALRETTLPIFEDAMPEDWQKTGTHPEWGMLTLRQLLELYADHSERHLQQVLHIRALLGQSLDLSLLLKTRLY